MLFVAIDVETLGRNVTTNGIRAVGVVVGNEKGEVSIVKRFVFERLEGQRYEKRCKREFWDKNPRLEEEFGKTERSVYDCLLEIRGIIDAADARDGPVMILTDNPAFDCAVLNTYFERFGIHPLHYTIYDEYRTITCVDSMIRGKTNLPATAGWVSTADAIKKLGLQGTLDPSKHDHFPENDAKFIYDCFIAFSAAEPSVKAPPGPQ